MNGHKHHLPGRLRLRFAQLKQDAAGLARVTAALRGIDGVLSVRASQITGAMLIYYDPVWGNTRRFWNAIDTVLGAHQLTDGGERAGCEAVPGMLRTGVRHSARALAAAFF